MDAFKLMMAASSGKRRADMGGASHVSEVKKAKASELVQHQQYGSCPLCERTIPAAFLETHVAACLETNSGAPPPPPPPPPAASQASASQPDGATQDKADAFKALMKGAATLHQHHVYYLEFNQLSRCWRWHWWQKGVGKRPEDLPPKVWSATMQVKEPAIHQAFVQGDEQPVQLTQATQAAPGHAAGSGSGAQQAEEAPTQTSTPAAGGTVRRSTGGARAAGSVQVTLHLETNVPPEEGGSVDWSNQGLASNRYVPPEGRWKGLPSGLKSALQKCCRLGRTAPATRLALHMLKTDAGEVLRRLPIICVEDSILHPDIPLITWLMAAHAKGYRLGVKHAAALLQITHQMTASQVRDYLPPSTMCPGHTVHSFAQVDAGLPHHPQAAALVKSLLLRAHFGGMPGDVSMLKGYAGYWMARCQAAAAHPPPHIAPGPAPSTFQPASALAHPACDSSTHATTQSGCRLQHSKTGGADDPQGFEPPSTQQEGVIPGGPAHTWTQYLAHVNGVNSGAAPDQVYDPCEVGLLRKGDIPLSAIDHHVSNLIEHLLGLPEVQQAAAGITCASWGPEGDAEECLRAAVWLFRSATNHRHWLPHLYGQPQAGAGIHKQVVLLEEHFPLQGDLERDEARMSRLEPLWRVAAPHADKYSANIIRSRFQAVIEQQQGHSANLQR